MANIIEQVTKKVFAMKILITTDGSPCSEYAFEHAINDPTLPHDCQFKVLSVVEALVGAYPVAECYVESMVDAEEALKKERQKLVTECIARLRKKYPKANISGTVTVGYPADQILTYAGRWGADLIILGSHGRRGLNHFIMGSVAERVAREAECSVEIIRGGQPKPATATERDSSNKVPVSQH